MLFVTTALAVSVLVTVPGEAAAETMSSKVLLARLRTAPEHPRGFARQPPQRWTDVDGDGCSTKAEVLLRDARRDPEVGPRCRLTGGAWVTRYDGLRHRGKTDIAVARLIPLAEAWQSGARHWSAAKRRAFANDVGYRSSLTVLSKDMKRARGEQDPQDWLPDGNRRGCRYLARWVAVKYRWRLAVDQAERDFLTDALSECEWPRAAEPRRPAFPRVRGLGATAVAATSMVARCAVSSSEEAHVVVRFGPVGRRLWRRSAAIDVAPGRTQARLSLHGLLPSTAYAFRCTAITPNTGLVRAPSILQATTLASLVPASGSPTQTAGSATSAPPTTTPPTTPPTTTPPAPPTTTSPPPPSGGTTIVAVGDMCEPNPASCNGTGEIAAKLTPALYALLGDTQYEKGTLAEYTSGYAKSSWNALKGLSYPAIGNHEIQSGSDSAYCGFFPLAHCVGSARWYAYDIDANWRAIVLDSNRPSNTEQLAWLDAELANDTSRNLLVYWHHARWRNSGRDGHSDSSVDGLMKRVYDAHVDIVLWGHDHLYTRWAKLGPRGPAPDGFRAFTVGTGGADLVGTWGNRWPGTEKNVHEFGVLELTLRADDYSWRFVVDTNETAEDSGSDTVTL